MISVTVRPYGCATRTIQVRVDDIAGDTLDGLYRSIGLVERTLSESNARELMSRAKLNPRVDEFVRVCTEVSPTIRAALAQADDCVAAATPATAS